MRTATGEGFTGVEAAQLLDGRSGWALTTERLAWTDDGGDTWHDITPPGLGRAGIQDIFFLDATTGWVASLNLTSEEPVPAPITVWQTSDSGRTWDSHSFEGPAVPKHGPPTLGRFHLSFVDEDRGWLSATYQAGMARGIGLLYRTTDGGMAWEKVTEFEGGGDPVRFVTKDLGWWLGGPNGYTLHVSRDGGAEWAPVELDLPEYFESYYMDRLPVFDTAGTGMLTAVAAFAHWTELLVFLSQDGGTSWKQAITNVGSGQLVFVDAFNWFAFSNMQLETTRDAGTKWQYIHGYWYTNDPQVRTDNIAHLAPAAASFLDTVTGWAILDSQHYQGILEEGKYEMTRVVALMATQDGGRNWTNLTP